MTNLALQSTICLLKVTAVCERIESLYLNCSGRTTNTLDAFHFLVCIITHSHAIDKNNNTETANYIPRLFNCLEYEGKN